MSQFNYYDIVKVISTNSDLREVHDKRGIVRGISQHKENPKLFYYAVYFVFLKQSWFIAETDLKATGHAADPSVVETDLVVTVRGG